MGSAIVDDIKWVDANYEDLHRKFAGKYIVVKNGKVVIVADDFSTADRRAKEVLKPGTEYVIERIEHGDLYAYF